MHRLLLQHLSRAHPADFGAADIGRYFAFIFSGPAKAKDTGNDSSNPIIQEENTHVLCYIVTFTSIPEMNTVKVSVSNR